MYFGPGISVGRRGISYGDADAQAFISATGLTGTTEVNAVTNLVANLKTYGLWSKMKAIYPFVSDTTNLVSYSEEFTNAAWVRRRITVVDNAVASPLGTNTASTITEDNTTNTHEFGNPSGFSISSSQNVTISIYVKKAGTRDWFAITMYNNSGVDKVGYYNISNGTLGNFDAGITGTITSIGNGWYRLSATGNFATTGNYFGFKGASANGTISYLGSGALQYYVWGAQLELGSTMTTYQPIATTPANRFVSQFKYNLKDPRDLDAAFRLAFNGTWAYSKQGATPNGVNGYANTYLNPVAQGLTTASAHLSYYARTVATTSDPAEMGNYTNNSIGFVIQSKSSLGTNLYYYSYPIGASRAVATAPTGLIAGSSIANTRRDLYLNGVSVANNTSTDSGTLGNYNLYIGAANINNTSVASYTNSQCGFSSIGNGLTDSEMANYYTSVQQFNQDLSRQVGVPIVSDADAQSFLNAAQITDLTQANAINTLVVGLKNASLWTKMKAIYPFVGGTATSHKWNLKDPRDLDAAYRLAFFGAWTHSSTGALPNGTNAYADTFLVPNTVLGQNSKHLSSYARTTINNTLLGAGDTNTSNDDQIVYLPSNLYGNLSSIPMQITHTGSTGLYAVSRTTNTTAKNFRNGTLIANDNQTSTGNTTRKIYLGVRNLATPDFYSTTQQAFASIGDGLTDAEISSMYTLVQNFQTTLGRQV